MSDVYIIEHDGSTAAMDQVQCKDEEKELQEILEKNYNLLPGSQIRPDDPWKLQGRGNFRDGKLQGRSQVLYFHGAIHELESDHAERMIIKDLC